MQDLDGIQVKTRTSDSEAMYFYKGEMDEVEMKMESYEKKAQQLETGMTSCSSELQALRVQYDTCMANPETAATCQAMLVPPASCTGALNIVKVQKDLLAEIRDLEIRVNQGASGAAGGLSIEKDKIRQKLEDVDRKVNNEKAKWTEKIQNAKALIASVKAKFDQADSYCAGAGAAGTDCMAYSAAMAKLSRPKEQLDNISKLEERIGRLLSAMGKTPRPVGQLEEGINKLNDLLQGRLPGKEQEQQQKIAMIEQLQPQTLSIFDYPQRLQAAVDLQGSPKDIGFTDASATEVYTRHILGILRKGAGCRGVGACTRSHLTEENDYWEQRHHPTADLKQKGEALVYNRETPWSLYRLMTLRANLKNQPEPLNDYKIKIGKIVGDVKSNAETLKRAHDTLVAGSPMFAKGGRP